MTKKCFGGPREVTFWGWENERQTSRKAAILVVFPDDKNVILKVKEGSFAIYHPHQEYTLF